MAKEKKDRLAKREENAMALMPRTVADAVTSRVQALTTTGELHLPENYSAPNALKSAWLAINNSESRDKLLKCTDESTAEALLDMVIQGLNPSKDQCYFIPFGNRVVCMRSYIGTIALLKRIYGPRSRVWPVVVYDGDTIEKEYDRGRLTIAKHALGGNEGKPDKIVAAYCVVEPDGDHEPYTEWMEIAQIQGAWKQGAAKGNSPAHKGFPDEMAKKTVINRACKVLIKSSDDAYLIDAIERQEALTVEAEMDAEVAAKANAAIIDIEPENGGEATEPEPAEQPTAKEIGDEIAEASPSAPSARFLDFMNEHDLNSTDARKLLASIVGVDSSRKLTNAHYKTALEDTDSFLALYQDKHGPMEAPAPQGEPDRLPDF